MVLSSTRHVHRLANHRSTRATSSRKRGRTCVRMDGPSTLGHLGSCVGLRRAIVGLGLGALFIVASACNYDHRDAAEVEQPVPQRLALTKCEALAPQRFLRVPGRPNEFEVPFDLDSRQRGPFTLLIQNGEQSPPNLPWYCRLAPAHPSCWWNTHRTTVGNIYLNDTEILGHRAFSLQRPTVERDVVLEHKNLLRVRLVAPLWSFISVRITDNDRVSPVVTINEPATGLVTRNVTIAVKGVVNDDHALVSVNGQQAPLSNEREFDMTIPLVEGENSIVASASDACGNASSSSITVTRDTTPPTTDASVTDVCSGTVTLSGTVTIRTRRYP
jgi:hypothetical protein